MFRGRGSDGSERERRARRGEIYGSNGSLSQTPACKSKGEGLITHMLKIRGGLFRLKLSKDSI